MIPIKDIKEVIVGERIICHIGTYYFVTILSLSGTSIKFKINYESKPARNMGQTFDFSVKNTKFYKHTPENYRKVLKHCTGGKMWN